jgi:DNA-binding NarL/FixJ family response regulator
VTVVDEGRVQLRTGEATAARKNGGARGLEGLRVSVVCRHTSSGEALAAWLEQRGAVTEVMNVSGGTMGGQRAPHAPDACIVDESALDLVAGRSASSGAAPTGTVLLLTRSPGHLDPRVDGVVARDAGLDVISNALVGLHEGRPVGRLLVPSPRTAPPLGGSALSDRELEVLSLLADGATNARIAEELDISVNTVRTHVQGVLRKRGVTRRSQAVRTLPGQLPGTRRPAGASGPTPSAAGRAVRVVLVLAEGHRVLAEAMREQLAGRLASRPVRVATTVEEVAMMVADEQPVTILDAPAGNDTWLDRLRELAQLGAATRALVLSETDDAATVIDALVAGAHGWVGRRAPFTAVGEAVDAVTRGEMYLSGAVMTDVLRELLTSAVPSNTARRFVGSLSPRELEILRCLVAGMTRDEIADRLFVSVNTVGTHVNRMLRRADRHSSLSLVALARQVGVGPP